MVLSMVLFSHARNQAGAIAKPHRLGCVFAQMHVHQQGNNDEQPKNSGPKTRR